MVRFRWLVLCGLLLLLTGCGSGNADTYLFDALAAEDSTEETETEEEQKVILLTHSSPEDSAMQDIAERFESLMEERSGGALQVEIYPDDSLGYVSDRNTPLVNGSVDMRIGSSVGEVLGCVLWIPTLSDISLEKVEELLREGELRTLLEEDAWENGVKLLATLTPQYRVMTSNVRVESLADFGKVSMRVISNNQAEVGYWQALGAETALYDLHQVYSALQQNLVNSQENTLRLIVNNSILNP